MEPTEEDIEGQRRLLVAHRQTLYGYLMQQALLGLANTPPGVLNGIISARSEIRRIKDTLYKWGKPAAEHPIDEATSTESAEVPPVAPLIASGHVLINRYSLWLLGAVILVLLIALPAIFLWGKLTVTLELQPTISALQLSVAGSAPDVAIASHLSGAKISQTELVSGTYKNIGVNNIYFFVHTEKYFLTPAYKNQDGTWKVDVTFGTDTDRGLRFDSGVVLVNGDAERIIRDNKFILDYLPEGTTQFNRITLQRQS
jgi:hypothetical protein